MLIRCDKNLIRGFVRRAKQRWPREYVELIYGHCAKDKCLITMLIEPEQQGKSNMVIWWEDEDAEHLDDLPAQPHLLGVIHSHPRDRDAAPSEFDWVNQRESRIAGICALWKPPDKGIHSRVRFYAANALLKMETI